MICLYAETNLSTFTLIFYNCICIPFLQIIQAAFRFFTFLLDPHRQPETSNLDQNPELELDLPVSRFQDLKSGNKNGGAETDHEEICAICLSEFEEEDWVNKLPKCGHAFHTGCMERWLDRCQFTCPLCRSSVLRVRSSPCRTWTSPFCIDLAHADDS